MKKQSDAGPVSQGKALLWSRPVLANRSCWPAGRLISALSVRLLCRMASLAALVSSLKLRDHCPDYEMVRLCSS